MSYPFLITRTTIQASAIAILFCTSACQANDQAPELTQSQPASKSIAPISISGLRDFAETTSSTFTLVEENSPAEGLRRKTVRFTVDKLEQFALIVTPKGPAPPGGWPVLIFNHGHHPDPPQYGRIESGVTDRPGNYYRQLPLSYAHAGFMVVVPDYRGHNDSQGFEYTEGMLEASWYARDSIAAFKAIPSLELADSSRVFVMGHSMGGEVTLKMILALGPQVRAAALWSTVAGDLYEQTAHYSFSSNGTEASSKKKNASISKLDTEIAALPFAYSADQGDPTRFLTELDVPLIIHHAIDDLWGTPYTWSVEVVTALDRGNKEYEFFSYTGSDHLLQEPQLQQAIERDVQFFRAHMK